MQEVATAHYRITGLVDIFDEQGIITGQFPIGSIQVLPVEFGDKAVEDARAERLDGEVIPGGSEGDEVTVESGDDADIETAEKEVDVADDETDDLLDEEGSDTLDDDEPKEGEVE